MSSSTSVDTATPAAATASTVSAPQNLSEFSAYAERLLIGTICVQSKDLVAHSFQRPASAEWANQLARLVKEQDLRFAHPLHAVLEDESKDLPAVQAAIQSGPQAGAMVPRSPNGVRYVVFSGQHRMLSLQYLVGLEKSWPVKVFRAGGHSLYYVLA